MASTVTISVLGDRFSYHHLAALAQFGDDNNFIFHDHFDMIVEHVQTGKSSLGLIAVTNSLAGEVPGNFARIADGGLFILGEVMLHISLNLGALPGTTLDELTTIYSHPMAWKETTRFFSAHPSIHFEPTSSTASGAKQISEENLRTAGAISSKTALMHYGLDMLAAAIDNHPDNITRFLVVGRERPAAETTNTRLKASLVIQCPEPSASDLSDRILKNTSLLYRTTLHTGITYAEIIFENPSLLDKLLVTLNDHLCKTTVIGVYENGKIFRDQ